MTQRSIKIVVDGQEDVILTITRATAVAVRDPFFHLDELEPNSWRLTYNSVTFRDMTKLLSIDFEGLDTANLKKMDGVRVYWRGINRKFFHDEGILTRVGAMVSPQRTLHFNGVAGSNEWRMLYTKDIISNIKALKKLEMVRID